MPRVRQGRPGVGDGRCGERRGDGRRKEVESVGKAEGGAADADVGDRLAGGPPDDVDVHLLSLIIGGGVTVIAVQQIKVGIVSTTAGPH